jgi:tryptophan-rich sensory protein
MAFRTASSIAGIALVLIYIVGSGMWVNTGDNWYRELNAPSWQPPPFIFGLIWPYNFAVLGIAAVLVSQRLNGILVAVYLSVFAISVVAALTWAYQFYGPHNLELASIALSIAAAVTIILVVIASRASWPIALALVPYQIWIITATTLSWQYAKLN